jgi:hypothetical protein
MKGLFDKERDLILLAMLLKTGIMIISAQRYSLVIEMLSPDA